MGYRQMPKTSEQVCGLGMMHYISFFFFLLTEIEAKEACDWLQAAGFPQYAQLYEGNTHTYTLQLPCFIQNKSFEACFVYYHIQFSLFAFFFFNHLCFFLPAVPPSFRHSSISRLQFLSRGRGHGKGLFITAGILMASRFPSFFFFFKLPTFFLVISNIFFLTHLFIKMCDFYSSSIGHPAARLGHISVNLQAFARVMVIRSHILEE